MLKNSKFIRPTVVVSLVLLLIFSIFLFFSNVIGNRYDNKLFDSTYEIMLKRKLGPYDSGNIVYIVIDDETYKDYFHESMIDRNKFANFLDTLAMMSPSNVIIDIIFAYPQDPEGDKRLIEAIKKLNSAFLPISFSLLIDNQLSHNSNESLQNKKLSGLMKRSGNENSIKGDRIISPFKELIFAARGVGHITESPDADGIIRHSLLFIEKDSILIPSLYLAAFLNYYEIPVDSVKIDWGNQVTIPSLEKSWLRKDVRVPIDKNARAYIPFRASWGNDYDVYSIKKFMEGSRKNYLFNELSSSIEGRIVVIGDVSTGIADISPTAIEKNAPMITIQANMLNALFSDQFIRPLDKATILLITILCSIAITFFILIRSNILSYLLCISIFLLLLLLSWLYALNLIIIPTVSLIIYSIINLACLILTVQLISFKTQNLLSKINYEYEQEMEEARKVQLSMLPQSTPQIDGYEIAVRMETASFVGGDYYDFFRNDDGSLTIILADATGHGLSAGTMVTVMKSLSLNTTNFSDLYNYLNLLSRKIKILKLPKLYVCAAIFKISGSEITYSSAGIPPLIVINENKVEEHLIKGPPLGFKIDFPYEIKTINLRNGDTVLLFSDGIYEQPNKLDLGYGIERLKIIAANNFDKSPSALIDKIINDCKIWSGSNIFKDDVTLLAIKKSSN